MGSRMGYLVVFSSFANKSELSYISFTYSLLFLVLWCGSISIDSCVVSSTACTSQPKCFLQPGDIGEQSITNGKYMDRLDCTNICAKLR